MFIVEIIPLTLLPPNVSQILSYFFDPVRSKIPLGEGTSADHAFQAGRTSNGTGLPKGAIVEVAINKRKVKAVVILSSPIEKQKLTLKKVDFQIKKINKVLFEDPQVSDYQLKLAVWIAKYYYAPLGYTLKTILPPFAFKKKYPIMTENHPLYGSSTSIYPQMLIYKTHRLIAYLKPLIKKTAPRQVLIMVSEKSSIKYFYDALSKEFDVSVVFSGMPNEKLHDAWQKAQSGETSVVVGTRQSLNMHFKDLGLIVVDDPLHEFYKSDMMPRYNAVTLAHKVAELNNSQLVLASVVPGVENHYKATKGEYGLKNVESRPKFETEIIDMAQEVKNGNWSPVSKKLNEDLLATLKNNKKALIFSPRRGYAGILVCSNCGSAVKCPQCEVAMRTHRSIEIVLTCHHCETSRPIPKSCLACGSSNFKSVGPAGTQKIYDAIKSRLAASDIKSTVLALDTDIVKNETEEEEIISEISKSNSSVLIATQMVFSHRFYLNFDLIGIINADALTNMPDFRSEENLFYQIEKLVNFSPEKMIIQTYSPENKLIEKAARGDYIDFYDNELKLRQALNYPPFFKLVKLTFRHTNKDKASYTARITTEKLKIAIARGRLEEIIKIIEATPAYIEKERGLYFYNIFLKVQEDYQNINELPAVSLSNLLKYAGPGWLIDVEPRSLL